LSEAFRILEPSYDAMASIARFPYALGRLRFTEVLTFPSNASRKAATSPAFARLMRLTAIVLGTSYYKLTAPFSIETAFPLTEAERDFLIDVYGNGLGEFLARNKLERFGRLTLTSSDGIIEDVPAPELEDHVLLPIGGGKDSLVSVQLLEQAGIDYTPFAVNPRARSSAASSASVDRRSTSSACSIRR
jgi:hypothetical protein